MKHEALFPVEHLRNRDLPDAPLVMHRQVLERRFEWVGLGRLWSFVRLRRG